MIEDGTRAERPGVLECVRDRGTPQRIVRHRPRRCELRRREWAHSGERNMAAYCSRGVIRGHVLAIDPCIRVELLELLPDWRGRCRRSRQYEAAEQSAERDHPHGVGRRNLRTWRGVVKTVRTMREFPVPLTLWFRTMWRVCGSRLSSAAARARRRNRRRRPQPRALRPRCEKMRCRGARGPACCARAERRRRHALRRRAAGRSDSRWHARRMARSPRVHRGW